MKVKLSTIYIYTQTYLALCNIVAVLLEVVTEDLNDALWTMDFQNVNFLVSQIWSVELHFINFTEESKLYHIMKSSSKGVSNGSFMIPEATKNAKSHKGSIH